MQIVNIEELSEFLKVKPKTLYQWAELGQIPSVKLNGALRFDLEDIKKWVESHCKKSVGSSYNPFAQASGSKRGGK